LHKGKHLTREDLKNWRQITLTDYKTVTKSLANRLKKVIASIIDNDQTGYIKGRNISENIRLLEDLINYTNKENLPGALLFLDFKKAFDSIERPFIIRSLKMLVLFLLLFAGLRPSCVIP